MNIEICSEIEVGNMLLEVTVLFDYYPGEKMVRYYPDGSGYPGSPPECDYRGVIVDSATGADYEVTGITHSDWFDLLDEIVDAMIAENKNGLLDKLTEDAIYEWEDAYEDF